MTENDLKPRGKKAPMHLVPWDVVLRIGLGPTLLQKAFPSLPFWSAIPPSLLDLGYLRGYLGDTLEMLAENFSSEEPWTHVARVFEYGALKYAPDNWRGFDYNDEAKREYMNAFVRHACAADVGDGLDKDSGCPHLAHCVCCLLILAYHEERKST